MAEEKAEEKPAGEEAPKKPLNFPLILAAANGLFVLAVLGFAAYSKLVFKRPAITESEERAKLATQVHQKKEEPGSVKFDQVTVNIATNPKNPEAAPGTERQLQGKLHYITFEFVLEIRDQAKSHKLDEIREVYMDEVLGIVGRKSFDDLNSVQGRFLLRTQLQDIANRLLKEPLVTNAYFTNYILQ